MIGSIYFSSGTYNESVFCTEIAKEMVKQQLRINYRGLAAIKHDASGAVTIINDFKKQKKLFHVIGDIIAYGGSTAWQHQIMLGSLFEAGGTFNLTAGSDGTFAGIVPKYKITHIPPADKFQLISEFECGSSRT